ncbi:MAG TPA: T9SS type A sorting domain-containing protein, partial [Ignavibacteriaceae bacterium]
RYYDIEPSNNSGLNATFRFYYDESELNGIPEANLRLFKSPDGSDNSWSAEYGTVNSAANYVENGGVNDFSYWTLGDSDNPLPVDGEENQIPVEFMLYQNYPNPFNPKTVIKFDLPESGDVSLKIFNLLGEEVARLVNEELHAGVYQYEFDASNLSSGVYLYKLSSNKFTKSYKMILMK